MAAVTVDQTVAERATQGKVVDTFAIVTGQTVYVGTLCCHAPGGSSRVRNGVKTASYRVAGIVEEIINDSGAAISAATGNTAGTVRARVSYGHEVLLGIITAARTTTSLGMTMLLSTNVDVDGTAVGTALLRLAVGQLMEFEPGTSNAQGWVKIRATGKADAAG